MKRKISVLFLVLAITILNIIPVMAGTYSEDGTAECVVTAELGSTYSVSLPATLTLNHDSTNEDYRNTFQYGAKGNIAADKKVSITSDSSFTLTGAASGASGAVTASVSLPTNYWSDNPASGAMQIGTADYAMATGLVTAPITRADSYSGKFDFTFELVNK